MEEKYSYLSTIMKFKESCFGLNGIKKLLIKKILKSLLTIIVLIVAALTIFYIMFVFSESKIAINELIKIATTNDSKVVILWLMVGIIVLYIFADAKITIDDRIEQFKKELESSNIQHKIDDLVLESGMLKSDIVNYVSPKYGIDDLLLMECLIKDNSIIYSKFYDHLNSKGPFNKLTYAEKTLYFVISMKFMLAEHIDEMFAYYFDNEKSIKEFCDIIFKEKSSFFIKIIEDKNYELFMKCFYVWDREDLS